MQGGTEGRRSEQGRPTGPGCGGLGHLPPEGHVLVAEPLPGPEGGSPRGLHQGRRWPHVHDTAKPLRAFFLNDPGLLGKASGIAHRITRRPGLCPLLRPGPIPWRSWACRRVEVFTIDGVVMSGEVADAAERLLMPAEEVPDRGDRGSR
jgi:hypothetical protein